MPVHLHGASPDGGRAPPVAVGSWRNHGARRRAGRAVGVLEAVEHVELFAVGHGRVVAIAAKRHVGGGVADVDVVVAATGIDDVDGAAGGVLVVARPADQRV